MICSLDRYSLLSFWLLIGSFSCRQTTTVDQSVKIQEEPVEVVVDFDLPDIKKRGYITAIMDNSSTGLFIYKGKTMGYEYELLTRYAEAHDLELRINVTSSLEEGFEKLNRGEGDILAYNLTVTQERKKRIAFTDYHNLVRQVLVQRKPEGWRDLKKHEIEAGLIRNPIDLIGKEVHVRHHSAHVTRLENLSNEIGGEILIIEEFPNVETEAIIRKVAEGYIDYSVAEEDVGLVNATFYPNIDVLTPISLPQQIAWGVRKRADSLLSSLNMWIGQMKKTADYYVIYDKYFKSRKESLRRTRSQYYSLSSDKISPYDELIKEAAIELGWDWRLLAAQVFKESKFNPNAVSWAGAIGLMQLLPKNGLEYGVKNLKDPTKNLYAGTQHLKWLQNYWHEKIDDPNERLKFVLGSFNVGHGHVMDAIRLARKYGKDPQLWDEVVAKMLILKSKPKYFNDPVVEFGYCRGEEPVDYVKGIFTIFQDYKALIPEEEFIENSESLSSLKQD